jgi:hypothetical protein
LQDFMVGSISPSVYRLCAVATAIVRSTDGQSGNACHN